VVAVEDVDEVDVDLLVDVVELELVVELVLLVVEAVDVEREVELVVEREEEDVVSPDALEVPEDVEVEELSVPVDPSSDEPGAPPAPPQAAVSARTGASQASRSILPAYPRAMERSTDRGRRRFPWRLNRSSEAIWWACSTSPPPSRW
jgi:hypothetical protein